VEQQNSILNSKDLSNSEDENTLRKKVGQLQTTVDLLKGEKDSNIAKIVALEKKLKQIEIENENLYDNLEKSSIKMVDFDKMKLESDKVHSELQAQLLHYEKFSKVVDDLTAENEMKSKRIEDLEIHIDQLCFKLKDAVKCQTETSLSSSDDIVDHLNQQIMTLQNQLLDEQQQQHVIKNENAVITKDLTETVNRLKKSKLENENLTKECESLGCELQQKQDMVSKLTSDVALLNDELDNALNQIQELTEALDEASNNVNHEDIESLKSDIISLQNELKVNTNLLEISESKCVMLENRLENDVIHTDTLQNLEEKCVRLNERIETLSNDCQNYQDEVEKLITENKLKQDVIVELENKVSESDKIAAQEQQIFIKAAEIEMNNLQNKIMDLTNHNTRLNDELSSLEITIKQLNKNLTNLEYEIIQKDLQLNEKSKTLEKLQSQAQSNQSQFDKLKDFEKLMEKYAKQEEKLSNYKSHLENLNKNLTKSNEENTLLEENLEQLKKDVEVKMKEKDDRIAHLDKLKLTKDQLASFKKLKSEHKKYADDNKVMKKQLIGLNKVYDR
jgi:chromosome segregation ATPase